MAGLQSAEGRSRLGTIHQRYRQTVLRLLAYMYIAR